MIRWREIPVKLAFTFSRRGYPKKFDLDSLRNSQIIREDTTRHYDDRRSRFTCSCRCSQRGLTRIIKRQITDFLVARCFLIGRQEVHTNQDNQEKTANSICR